MSNVLGLSRRALSKRPISSASRSLATVADSTLAPDPTIEVMESTDGVAAEARHQSISAFNSTALPTPYHPFVHLPLLSFHASPNPIPRSDRTKVERPQQGRLVVPLPSNLFNTPSRPSLLHKLVVAHLASLRRGTASTKNRSEVNFSGKKIRPQKGTGGARLGSRGSPMLIGGGRAFGPRPKGPDGWKLKVNRKEERLGLAVGLSDKWRGGDLSIVESFGMDIPSTATLATRLSCRGWSDALFILASPDAADGLSREKQCFEKSLANLPNVGIVTDISTMGIWEIIKRKKVIIELSAVDEVIKRLDPDNHSSGFEYDDDDDEDWEGFPELDESMMAEEIEQALKGVDLASK